MNRSGVGPRLCGHRVAKPGCPVCARRAAAQAVKDLPDMEAQP